MKIHYQKKKVIANMKIRHQGENSWLSWKSKIKMMIYHNEMKSRWKFLIRVNNEKNHHQDDNSSWKFIIKITIIKISIKWASIFKLKFHNLDEMSSSRWDCIIKMKCPFLGADLLLRWKFTIKLNIHWGIMNDYQQHKIWWWKFIIMIKIHY